MSPALAVTGTGKFGWGNLLASGDFDFITSASGTAVASISIDNCFSAGYDHYLVMRNLLGSTGGDWCNIRLRVGGVDASAADYRWQLVQASTTTVAGSRSTGQTSFVRSLGYNQATSYGFARAWISNPFAAVRTTAWSDHDEQPSGNISINSYVYEHDLATSYDGMSLTTNSGTFTGSIYVYGLAV